MILELVSNDDDDRPGLFLKSPFLQSDFLVCGGPEGTPQSKTCLSLTAGGWVKTHDLQQERVKHISWTTGEGTVLIGGYKSQFTTEIVKQPGVVETSFELRDPAL